MDATERLDQAVFESLEMQAWHELVLRRAPSLKHPPPMRQWPALTGCVQVPAPSQTSAVQLCESALQVDATERLDQAVFESLEMQAWQSFVLRSVPSL